MTATEFKKQLPRILPNELIQFLKKEKIFRAYTDNCYKSIKNLSKYRIEQDFNSFKRRPLQFQIVCAFDWQYTIQGFDFWKKVDMKFCNNKV